MVKTVMIVDDNPDVILSVKHGIEGNYTGYEVVSAESGQQCLEFLENNPIPDIILLDIMMPEMNGWLLQKKLQESIKWRNIPILFLTAIKDSTSKKIGDVSSNGVIEKPFEINDLKLKIDSILIN